MRFSVTKFADIVMYEVLKQIDEKVDKERNENQMRALKIFRTPKVSKNHLTTKDEVRRCIRGQVVHIHMLDNIENI